MKEEKRTITTYEELVKKGYSSFEVVLLASQRAIELIRKGVYTRKDDEKLVPKLAVRALDDVLNNDVDLVELKHSFLATMFSDNSPEEPQEDDYNVDQGHLPKSGTEQKINEIKF